MVSDAYTVCLLRLLLSVFGVIQPAFYNLYLVFCVLCPVSCALYSVSCVLCPVPCIRVLCPVS